MSRIRFHGLVEQYTQLSVHAPAAFRRRLGLLVGGALIYFAGVLALLAGVAAWVVATFAAGGGSGALALVGIFSVLGLFSAAVGLVSKVQGPGGHRLAPEDAPGLFELLDDLRRRMGVGELSSVWLDGQFNAAASQRPLFGLAGFARHHLVLGLPLLAVVPLGTARAIVAHELAHFAKRHGHWGPSLYRFGESWNALRHAGLPGLLLVPFDLLFGARLAAAMSVHGRRQEFEADAHAAETVGREAVGAALVRIQLGATGFETRFVEEFARTTAMDPEPPADAMTRAVAFLRSQPQDGPLVRRALRAAYGESTDLEDTHPTLFDRLRELRIVDRNAEPEAAVDRALALLAATAGPNAIEQLAADPSALVATGDAEARKEMDETWEEARRQAAAAHERASELARRAAGSGPPLEVEEEWEHVGLIAQREGPEAGRGALEDFLARHGDHADACLWLATLLYDDGDAACLGWAERAAQNDPVHGPAFTALQQQWWRETGEGSRADAIHVDLLQQQESLDEAAAERESIGAQTRFAPHELGNPIVERLVSQLREAGGITRAYLVRRELKHLAEHPQYLIAVKIERKAWWRFQGAFHEADVLRRLFDEVTFPHDWLAVSLGHLPLRARRRIRRVAGARILPA